MADEELLRGIQGRLSALLAISVDQYLRDTGVARPRPRSIDRMLSDVGLTAQDIAALLGKTDRAVHMVLAGDRTKKVTKKRGKVRAESAKES